MLPEQEGQSQGDRDGGRALMTLRGNVLGIVPCFQLQPSLGMKWNPEV